MKKYAFLFFVLIITNSVCLQGQTSTNSKRLCPFDSLMQEFISFDSLLVIVKDIEAFAVYERGCLVHWGPVRNARRISVNSTSSFEVQTKQLVNNPAEDAELQILYFQAESRKFKFLRLELLSDDANLLNNRATKGATIEVLDTLATIY